MKTTLTKKIELLFDQPDIEMIAAQKISAPKAPALKTQITLDKMQLQFETLDNDGLLENISYMATKLNTPFENWNLFFTRLIPFFEVGFLFSENKLQNQFLFGKEISAKKKSVQLQLPKSNIFQILRTDAHSVLTKMNLSNLFQIEKMNCFYIRVDNHIGLMLMTAKAEPWLQLKMDSLQKALINHQL